VAWRRAEQQTYLSSLLQRAGQPDRARQLLDDALRQAQALDAPWLQSSIHTSLAILLADTGNSAETLTHWQAAIDLARLAGAARAEALGLANIADYYLKQRDWQTTYDLAAKALPLGRALHNEGTESVALANMGLALIGLGHKDEGLALWRQSVAIDIRNGNLSAQADSTLELAHYLEAAGHGADALKAWRQGQQLRADFNQQDRARATLELQEGYANEQRQHELDMLSREVRLKDEQLINHELRVKQWTAAGLACLLALGVVAELARRLRERNRQLRHSNEALRLQAERDPLTGLANRHHLQSVMAARPAARGLEGSLFLLDVDHFKHINDRCGHAGGDIVLVEIARRLQATLRDEDLIVRWGGEEFLVLMPPMPVAEADLLARRMLAALADQPVAHGGLPIPVSASIGYGLFPLPGHDAPVDWERALALVDTALYLSKAHGRNCATGIHHVEPEAAADLDRLSRTLEAAWQSGSVALSVQHGPRVRTTLAGGSAATGPAKSRQRELTS